MRVIGITGGIGSGKSTVSRVLIDLGAKVIDADVIAREIVLKGELALEEVVKHFGSDILNSEGELDRKKLANIVFTNKENLETLNRITHKYIADKIFENLEKVKTERLADIVVVDAAIPIEHGFLDAVDVVWVIIADRETRIKRIMDRNCMTYEEALNRIKSQIVDEEYLKVADEIIYNNGSIEELEKSVVKLLYSQN